MSRVNLNANDALICFQRRLTEGESLPRCLAKRQTENNRKEAAAARDVANLPRYTGSKRDRTFDRLARSLKSGGTPRWKFWSSDGGKACLKLLTRAPEDRVAAELRRRGLGNTELKRLRRSVFEHVRNRVADTILTKVRPEEKLLSQLIRQPGMCKAVADQMATQGTKQRLATLRSLGIVGAEAKAIARAPQGSEKRLEKALRQQEKDLSAVLQKLQMSKNDPKAALTVFALLDKAVEKVRADMGLSKYSGSFAGRAVDRGLGGAKAAKEAEELYGKFTGAAISIVGAVVTGGAGVILAPMLAGAKGAPAAGKAVHRGRLAATGEDYDLAHKATAKNARNNARQGVKKLVRDVALAGLKKLAGKALSKGFEATFRQAMAPTLEQLDSDQADKVVEQAMKWFKAGRKVGGSWAKVGVATHRAAQ